MKKKILLMGNPNVGKSIFFSELTGVHAVSSNFAGTTVDFLEGRLKIGDGEYVLIDVPGTYSLDPSSEAEAVASRLMEDGASAIICVLDASNLERNLHLAMEVMQYKIPLVFALNMADVAERQGITVNTKQLEKELGAPVVQTVAVKKQGFDELIKKLGEVLGTPVCGGSHCGKCPSCNHAESGDKWLSAKEISGRVSKKNSASPSFMDKLGMQMIRPFPGLLYAAVVLALLVVVVVFGGRMLRMPLIMLTDGLIIPMFRSLFEWLFAFFAEGDGAFSYRYLYYNDGFRTGFRVFYDGAFRAATYEAYSAAAGGFGDILLNVLIGEYGIFVISFQWIIALILPYVFSFYIGITFLEDSGYLPRISVLFDNVMRKLGVQGGSLIHVFLALGCAVPAILGSRTATTKKEKMMIAAVICFAVPCISQIGALVALMSAFSWHLSVAMLLFAMFLFVATAFVAGRVIKGRVDPLILEIPNLLMPKPKVYFRKLAIRMKHFLKDAELPMLGAVFLAALLAGTGVLAAIANQPQVQFVVSGWLGMPEEAVVSLVLGIVRREMSVAPLLLLNLTYLQAFVAGVVSLLYLPCLSVFGILAKEFKIGFAIAIFAGTVVSAILVGGFINQVAQIFL
ncbi:MAG: ferrous iron transporter B [Defluviitaleaceae bacterium]|nr:ferrous iron transporter B [Defluviitaleaceae bacterium]MCL2262914.1 ferrous iron transporter B [Defluviitaleaceae bacterium]